MNDPATASGAISSDDSDNGVSWGRRLLLATVVLAAGLWVSEIRLPTPPNPPPVVDDATRRWRIVQQEFSLADLPPNGQVLNSGKDYSLFSGTTFLLTLSFSSRAELDAFRDTSPLLANATPQPPFLHESLATLFGH